MARKLLYLAALVSMLAAPAASGAQDLSALKPGSRVRLVTPVLDAEQRTGKLVSAANDTIQFRADVFPVTRTIPLSQITSLEVSTGKVNNKRRFALIGLAAGAAGGFAAGYHPTGGSGPQMIGGGKKSASENAFLSAAIAGALGGIAGWIWGGSHSSENWVSVHGGAK